MAFRVFAGRQWPIAQHHWVTYPSDAVGSARRWAWRRYPVWLVLLCSTATAQGARAPAPAPAHAVMRPPAPRGAHKAPAPAASRTAYLAARTVARKLLAMPPAQRRREAYAAAIASLERIARDYPQAYEAPRALFLAGDLYRAQFTTEHRDRDAQAALLRYSRVYRDYPQASLADDAMWAKAELLMQRRDKVAAQHEVEQLLQHYPQGDKAPRAKAMAQLLSSTLARGAPDRLTSRPNAAVGSAAAAGQLRSVSIQSEPTPVQRQGSLLLPRRRVFPAPIAQRRRVVIDPGHGGHDSGAIGPGGTFEKHVVLAIARQAQSLLLAQGVDVILTRDDDTFVSLQDRTQLANHLQADAFVSVHANSAPRPEARGIETYTLDIASDRYAVRLAALENKTSEKEVTDLQLILADLSTKGNSQDSVLLAHGLQKKMVAAAHQDDAHTRDLGVKASLFYVLLGARMPAVLLETSFVSNPQEERLLRQLPYQRRLGQAICTAVLEYLHSLTNAPML